ncbi:3-keto-5-aminohexanoate cleavage protein [Mesorhizobium sp. M0902]|uniref:3-keto-5-aminohexanoate cleavage protein n=1 Tax=Mesorhizobium sp. M0902 TaxID=2957021 RepID=UPI00333C7BC3
MISEAFITCAVTGSGANVERSPHVPVSPEEIANSAIEAARAGAAVVHIHVRDAVTKRGSREPALYREVVHRLRASDVNPVINLTTGLGGDLTLGGPEAPLPPNPNGTEMVGATERLIHVEELLPEICTLDCGSMNFGNGEYVMINTYPTLRKMAARLQEIGVLTELEVFDTGHLWTVRDLVGEGLIKQPLVQMCMGIRYGAPEDPGTLMAMVNQLPAGSVHSAFSIGRMQMPYVAMAALSGGNVRVGLEDNLYLSRGRLATNAELVERAVNILDGIGVRVLSPDEVRQKLNLKVRS